MSKILILIVLGILLQGCTKAFFTAANAPKLVFDGEIKTDIAYGSLNQQTLDIYLPDKANQTKSDGVTNKTYPVVIFFHGGRWTSGNKDQYKFVGMRLAQLGYIAVIPDTRLYPEVKHPTFIDDSARAVAWTNDNIQNYGGNTNLFLLGHSSGAHMAALVSADERYLKAYNKDTSIINAFAGLAGPYDFVPQAEALKKIFGPPSQYPEMVVTNYIDGNEPPMLLIHTINDKTVHIRNLEKLKSGIQQADGKVESIIYESGGHTATVGAFSWANPSDLPVPRDVDAFFRRHTSN